MTLTAKDLSQILGLEDPERKVLVRIGDKLHEIGGVILMSLTKKRAGDEITEPIELIARGSEC